MWLCSTYLQFTFFFCRAFEIWIAFSKCMSQFCQSFYLQSKCVLLNRSMTKGHTHIRIMSCLVYEFTMAAKNEKTKKRSIDSAKGKIVSILIVCVSVCFWYHGFSFYIEYFVSATQWNLIHYSFTFYYESRIRILDYLCVIFKICDISNVQTFHFGHGTDSLDPNNENSKYAQHFFWGFTWFWSIFINFIHITDCHLIE